MMDPEDDRMRFIELRVGVGVGVVGAQALVGEVGLDSGGWQVVL